MCQPPDITALVRFDRELERNATQCQLCGTPMACDGVCRACSGFARAMDTHDDWDEFDETHGNFGDWGDQ